MKKTNVVRARLDDITKSQFSALADTEGKTMSELIVYMIRREIMRRASEDQEFAKLLSELTP